MDIEAIQILNIHLMLVFPMSVLINIVRLIVYILEKKTNYALGHCTPLNGNRFDDCFPSYCFNKLLLSYMHRMTYLEKYDLENVVDI